MLTEKDYCDYGITVALEELGFPLEEDYVGVYIKSCGYKRPSLYEAQKWLREEKNIYIDVACNKGERSIFYDFEILTMSKCYLYDKFYSSYEEALLEGVRTSIKILQDEQKENN